MVAAAGRVGTRAVSGCRCGSSVTYIQFMLPSTHTHANGHSHHTMRSYTKEIDANTKRIGEGGRHDRISRHVRTPLYRPRGVISGFEIVLHGVILPPLPLFARAGRIYWLEYKVMK